jgi:Glycosyl hydrolase family 99
MRRSVFVALVVGAVLALSPGWASAEPSGRVAAAGILQLQTVPPLAGVVVSVDGHTATSNGHGRISVPVRNFIDLEQRIVVPATQIAPDRKVVFDRFRGELANGARGKVIEMGIRTSRLVSWHFIDRFGADVPIERVQSMQLRSNTGETVDVSGPALTQPLWVNESRTQQGPNGLVSKQLYYTIDSTMISGTSVVNRAQQRFVPWNQQLWIVQLLLYRVSFSGSDMLFGDAAGKGVELTGPDGTVRRLPFGDDGLATVTDLPRGTYTVRLYGGGVSFSQPVSISKDQPVPLTMVSWLDIMVLIVIGLSVALGLIVIGRPRWRERLRTALWRVVDGGRALGRRWASRRSQAVALVLFFLAASVLAAPRPASAAERQNPVPVLAYYYIWYNPTSWNRAKVDYPLLGRYSSDDIEIMRRHVAMAKAAGITGFLVSWKHTPQLDDRLTKLAEVAQEDDFKLGIVYQGLDFAREPLPLQTVRSDLELFADTYAKNPVFSIFDKPLVIWTGSDQQTAAQIDQTVGQLRDRLLVLGNAKSVAEVAAEGAAVDGQAYYWSSVDPTVNDTGKKLTAMAQAVHALGGLWIAPVAPGFDARLVGGDRAVPRRDGQTLRLSFAAAQGSNPDAIGMISWNEFSENTHIEPSEKYGATDLNTLAEIMGARATIDVPMDSSDVTDPHGGLTTWGALAVAVSAIALLFGLAMLRRRRSRDRPPPPPAPLTGE